MAVEVEVRQKVAAGMSAARFAHTERVAATAAALALRYGADPQAAEVAGMLHDLARDWPPEALLQTADTSGILKREAGSQAPVLLHAPVAALVAQRDFGITDPEILEAIALHTTGSPQMGLLAQVVYVADAVEPGRNYPGSAELREAAERSLTYAVCRAAGATIRFLIGRGLAVELASVETYNTFLTRAAAAGG